MAKIDQSSIHEFQNLYLEIYGREIDEEYGSLVAHRLIDILLEINC